MYALLRSSFVRGSMRHGATVLRSIVLGLACLAPALGAADAAAQTPPSPWSTAAAAQWLNMTYEQLRPLLAQLPCPLPGLPPEITRLVDCKVLRPLPNPTPVEPLPPTPGGTPAVVDHRTQGLVGNVRDQGEVG